MGRKNVKQPKMSEEDYLRIHLGRMDEVKRKWYMDAMKTWGEKDYENYAKFYRQMLGESSDESH